MKKLSVIAFVVVLLFVFKIAHSERTIWYVHPDSALNTIQAGLDSCADNDIVLVAPGTYVENIVWPSTQGIHLISELGPEVTMVDGDSISSVIVCSTGVDTSTVMRGLTLTNGLGIIYAPYQSGGGGIYLSNNSHPILENIVITENTADPCGYGGDGSGGGIYCNNASPRLINVTINGNTAVGYIVLGCGGSAAGGGIACYNNSSPHLTNVTITNNRASHLGCHGFAGGGGIYCENSTPNLLHVTISENIASGLVEPLVAGGGICCESSNPSLVDVTIIANTTCCNGRPNKGGGIYCNNSSPNLSDVIVSQNTAENGSGGGIACYSNSNPHLANVTISDNNSEYGGGIYCENSNLDFDSVNRCNIFLNYNISEGNDIYVSESVSMNVIVDTFTVIQPDNYFAYPFNNFAFDILHGKVEQANQDLYVSPTGSDDNGGLTVDDPLLTMTYALIRILADSTNPLAIHLANGIYSVSQTGERFPLNCRSYVSLLGEDGASTILDGEGLSKILVCINDSIFSVKNMIIENGTGGIFCSYANPTITNVTLRGHTAERGGGIFCDHSSPYVTNVTICGNTAVEGGGIACQFGSRAILTNVLISENSADYRGGGIKCHGASPILTNVTISGNTAGNGGGLYCMIRFSRPNLMNCILWNDFPNEIYVDAGSTIVNYSDIQGGWFGSGNINTDPMFESGPLSDYHLALNSPCIDAGNPDPQYNDPEDPNYPGYALWPALGTVRNDMGAYGGPGAVGWIGVEEHNMQEPKNTILRINPNPFRRFTTISYQTSHIVGDIGLRIYDITGREVRNLTKQVSVIDHQLSVNWNGTDNHNRKLPSGIYFLELMTGDYIATKKLLLIR